MKIGDKEKIEYQKIIYQSLKLYKILVEIILSM